MSAERLWKSQYASNADVEVVFGLKGGMVLSLETYITGTSNPLGVQSLQREDIVGYQDVDLGSEAFDDPAGGGVAVTSKLELRNLQPGRYKYFYDRTSGGTTGNQITLRINMNRP